ncbi:MAG TPA: RagB/SusD family nutrient uptake outer membrane protein [Chitinophagaceae bacterium]|nr:RagB/SusD family nutrient uptake outer membrane protein [Chitinophagaceae bacterium]
MKNLKIVISSLLLFTAFACKKVIEIKETDFIGGDIALQTVSNNEQGVIGAYAQLQTEMQILLNATMSDEVKKAEFYNAATTHEWQFTSSDIGIRDNFTAFTPFYRAIDRVNRVLQALPEADSLKPADNQALRTRLRGEALFIRAFSHFELYRFYSGATDPNALAMAYMETPSLEPTARITVAPYFQKLKADLAEAKNLLPNNLTDVYRANRLTVSGLQARVALYLKEWQDAITFSTEYINGIPLATRAQFPGIWTDANSAEVAFKLRRTTAAGGRIGSLFRGTSANATQIGTISWMPSDKIWNSFDMTNDVRFASYLKDEPLLASAGRPSHIVQKYAGTGYGTAAENVADAKVFRTGEMYLIRAEAKAETNDLIGGALDLNNLRVARITNYTSVAYTSKDALITAIIDERFKELAFEGHRLWDLRRRNLPVERLASDAPTANSRVLPAGNFRFLLPIPNAEIQANPLIQQNPGYSN